MKEEIIQEEVTTEQPEMPGAEQKPQEDQPKEEEIPTADVIDTIPALKAENAKLQKQVAEASDKYLRMIAEYDNYRKRAQKERDGIYADAFSDVLVQILPIVDNLERAAQFSAQAEVAEGVQMTLKQCREVLEKLGVTEIETKTFDPNLHNAVMHIEDASYGESEIVEVFQKGYRRQDKILRYAMVKVAN